MIAEITAAVVLISVILGIASLYINSRLGNFKSQIDDLNKKLDGQKEEIGELRTRLVAVETERDSAKKDLRHCQDSRIAVLEENRALNKIIRDCDRCKNARP